MMEDMTEGCLESASINKKKLKEKELRDNFCRQCKNYKCGHAKWGKPVWEERVSTQEDRLLNNPNFANQGDPKYSSIREIDFPNIMKRAITLEIADRNNDWVKPTSFDSANFLTGGNTEKESTASRRIEIETDDDSADETEENEDGDKRQQVKESIEVSSGTKNAVYTVTVIDGIATLCDCRAGQYGRKCSHLNKAEQISLAISKKKLDESTEDSGKETHSTEFNTDPIVKMTMEDKMELGGIRFIKNTLANPHGIMVGDNNATVYTDTDKPWMNTEREQTKDKKETRTGMETGTETRTGMSQKIIPMKPGSIIKF